ncbi:hypothetical protein KSF78_0002501 [Schistosoma japonicum]|nr:hypothetical protein KSF78_0002501 [Schistosoma japonicum]
MNAQQCKSRQSSPHLSSTDGHVSSISGLSESCEDSSNTYLNPDFTDSQLMTKYILDCFTPSHMLNVSVDNTILLFELKRIFLCCWRYTYNLAYLPVVVDLS